MKKITKVHSDTCPPEINVLEENVFVASNIILYTENIDNMLLKGYLYTYTVYTKDLFITLIAQQTKAIELLQDELLAAKILLGVDD